jgi:uncharacterized protein YqeY
MLAVRMRSDLTVAMKARDRDAVVALRTALAAIANAEAVPVDEVPSPPAEPIVGRAQEVPRRVLAPSDVEAIVRREVEDRRDTIEELRGRDQCETIERLSAEIAVLERYLD